MPYAIRRRSYGRAAVSRSRYNPLRFRKAYKPKSFSRFRRRF